MPQFVILEAPSALGLRATGVERLPEALKAADFRKAYREAHYVGRVNPLPSTPHRDSTTHLLNGDEIRVYSQYLADTLVPLLHQQLFPVVLGGDCSILIGATFALRRLGRYGLFFVDGHTDFYQPEAEPSGEVASMDLALISGRVPTLLSDIDGLRPLVRDEDVVAFGSRDAEQVAQDGSQDIRESPIVVYDLADIRSHTLPVAAAQGLHHLLKNDLAGVWIHVDADVLDDAVMPAVDYRQPDGLSGDELSVLLHTLMASGRVVGITIAIFNPSLDTDGSIARHFVAHLIAGLTTPLAGKMNFPQT